MRKCIVSILALLLCLSLAACGEPESTNTKPTGSTPAGGSKPTESAHIHTWTDATCVTPKTCIACGETEGEMVPHTYEESAKVDATPSQDGSVTYTCTGCGDSYKEILYATGSVGLEYEVNDDGTYTVVGLGTCTDSHVVIPRYYQGATVTAIGKRAFYDCHTIQEITIPKTVSSIGTQIFYKCSALHTVYYNGTYGSSENPFLNVANIKKVVFGGEEVSEYICYGLQNINEIVILDCVTSIGIFAFSGCSSLTSITIPASVTSIGDAAFRGCSSLTSITIPASVTSIGIFAFSGCSSLTSVTIPDSVTSIGSDAFSGCSSLTSITIPASITSINEYTFYGCASLTSVTIPDSITSIRDYAFSECSSLTSITIPASITSIGDDAFRGCNVLKKVNIYDLSAWCSVDFGDAHGNPLHNGAVLYLNGELVPELVIPDDVPGISDYTFLGCSSLTSVTIPDSVTSIGNSAFSECSSLTNVTIPDSVTSIGNSAFAYCASLTSIVIPDSVSIIGNHTFYFCRGLTSIVVPGSVTSIGVSAFYGCSSLTSVTIPDSVSSIGYKTFFGCSSLTSIFIPDSVTSIGDYAFAECSSLTDFHFGGTKEQWISIDKSFNWFVRTSWIGNSIVHCTDGDTTPYA